LNLLEGILIADCDCREDEGVIIVDLDINGDRIAGEVLDSVHDLVDQYTKASQDQ
jgi:hypothetical protein